MAMPRRKGETFEIAKDTVPGLLFNSEDKPSRRSREVETDSFNEIDDLGEGLPSLEL